MDDIVERLREVKRGTSDVRMVAGRAKLVTPYGNMMNEAADVIESLRSDISRLTNERDEARRALEPFAECVPEWDGEPDSLHVFLEWNDENQPVPSIPVACFRRAAAIRQKSDVPTDVNDMPEGECAHDWFDCSNAHVPPPAKSCRKCGWTVGNDETQGIYLIWPWLAGRSALSKEPGDE